MTESIQKKGSPSEDLPELFTVVRGYIDIGTVQKRNKERSWKYGYDRDYDFIVISKDGRIGSLVRIQNLLIALPVPPETPANGAKEFKNQYWERAPLPSELSKIKSMSVWNEMPESFKAKWVDYIEEEFDRRENGYWFMNNGVRTYITGSHYMYLQWSKIDVGYPDFREANRILFIHWEACKADNRCFGQVYVKIRRSGFSYMGSSETVNIATITRNARVGILSKTGADAKKMFTDKVVEVNNNLPFFFRPVQDGMDKPKTELSYKVPAVKVTRKNMSKLFEDDTDGLNTTIDWKNTGDNAYDGEKLKLLIHDECYHPDTKILDADMRFRPISSFNVGDMVTIDGGSRKKIAKVVSGNTDSYLIKQPYGKDYIVTENHRLILNQYGKGEVILTAKEFYNSSSYRKQHLTRVTSVGVESDDVFDGIPPFLLGLWLGNGRKNAMSILINSKEQPELLNYLGQLVQLYGVEFDILERQGCIEFRFKGINKELRKIGVYNNKHVPESYMKSSIDTRLQVLAGLLETDGYADKKKGTLSIGMASDVLVCQIREIALSCGLSCSNVAHKRSNFGTDVYGVSISGDLSKIPMISNKKSFSDYKPKTRGRRNKVDIEYIGKSDFVGIQVEAETDLERRLILEDYTVSLNSGKWLKPDSILNNWKVTKTCLRLGNKIVGKCMMGSTCNALNKGGAEFKELYYDSDVTARNANGNTKSGLYSLFIPMEWNMEGFIDKHGMPVMRKPDKPVVGIDGEMIYTGAVDYWENEVAALKSDPDGLNEFYRQFPRTVAHAFRDESKSALFNLTKIYQQVDYNDSIVKQLQITRGMFKWKNNEPDTEVVWIPDERGRFRVSWIPPANLRNRVIKRGDLRMPGNEHLGAFGCDSYDISGVVDGSGSNGALHGKTGFHMDNAPTNFFFLEYIARPATAEIFYEDVLMACVFYGMPILAENNKPRLLYHFKNRGYRKFSMNRPDKTLDKLSKTERELGGIPNNSEDVKQAHASAIEGYIEKFVGYDNEGIYRDSDIVGEMYFNRTLEDWARFDINNRTKHDASISSGLAIMATQKHLYQPEVKQSKISIKFARYNNTGQTSKIING